MSEREKERQQPANQSEEGKTSKQRQLTATSIKYEGVLPPASEMQRFENVLPGLADRITSMAEKEQDHRIFKERLEVILYWIFKFGAYAAVVSVVAGMLYGSYLLFLDGEITGGIAAIIGAVSTVLTAIVKGANKRNTN